MLLQLIVGLVFFQRHYQRVTEQLTHGVALELRFAIDEVERAGSPGQAQSRLSQIARPLDLALTLEPGATVTPGCGATLSTCPAGRWPQRCELALDGPLDIDLAIERRRRADRHSDQHGRAARRGFRAPGCRFPIRISCWC